MPPLPDPPAAPARAGHADPPNDATSIALARLASTRQRLLLTIAPHASASASRAPGSATGLPRRWRALWRMLMSGGPSTALLRAASATVAQWWHAQPWSAASGMLGQAVAQEVRPVVRRHPWGAIFTAMALGAAVVSARRLLWPLARSSAAPLPGLFLRGAWNLFTQVPVQIAITAVLAAWMGDQQHDATPDGKLPPAAAGAGPDRERP